MASTGKVAGDGERATAADSFETVFETYRSAIYRYTLRLTGNSDDAYDLTVASFEKAYRAWGRRPADPQVRPWLYRIATNTCVDEFRRRKLISWLPWDPFSDRHTAAADDPEDVAIRTEERLMVRAALARLSERDRAALILRECEELSCEQIGDVLGIAHQSVKVILFRTRQRLREAYRTLDDEETK